MLKSFEQMTTQIGGCCWWQFLTRSHWWSAQHLPAVIWRSRCWTDEQSYHLIWPVAINSCLASACVQLHLERAFVCNFSQFDLCSQLLLGWNKAIAQNWSGDNFEMLSNGFQSLEVWMARAIRGRMPPCWETRDSSDSTLWSAGLHIITSTYFNIIGSTQFHRPFVNELDSLQVKSNVWRFLEIGRLEIRMIMINMWWTATNAFVLSQTKKRNTQRGGGANYARGAWVSFESLTHAAP